MIAQRNKSPGRRCDDQPPRTRGAAESFKIGVLAHSRAASECLQRPSDAPGSGALPQAQRNLGKLNVLETRRRGAARQLVCMSRRARRKCLATSFSLIPNTAAASGSSYP